LIFYSPTGEKNSYQYIGKYNLNLDKATPEPFGFMHDEDFGWLEVGEPYYAVEYDDDGDAFIGQEDPTAGGDYNDTFEGEELHYVGYTAVDVTAEDYQKDTYYVNTGSSSLTKFELSKNDYSQATQYYTKDSDITPINAIHCFEFLDNAVEVCNFLNKYKQYIEDP
jgi:hypothetical protein